MLCPDLSRLALGVVSTGAVDDVLTEIAQERADREAAGEWEAYGQLHNFEPIDIKALKTYYRYVAIDSFRDVYELQDALKSDIEKKDWYHVQGHLCLLIGTRITKNAINQSDFKGLLQLALKLALQHELSPATELEASCVRMARAVAVRLDPLVEARHPGYVIHEGVVVVPP